MRSLYNGAEKRDSRQRRDSLDRRNGMDRRQLAAFWESFNGLRGAEGLERRTSSGRRMFGERRLNERRI